MWGVARVKYNSESAPTTSAIDDGGTTHVRYQHGLIPCVLDVSCPRCEQLANAELSSSDPARPLVEVGRHLLGWQVRCSQCVYRGTDVNYDDLPPLYWRVESGGAALWAWNREHLVLLKKVLDGQPVSDHPYEFLATYVRREWLRRWPRKSLSKGISRLLSTHAG